MQCHGVARLYVVLVSEQARALSDSVQQGRQGQLNAMAVHVVVPGDEGLAPVATPVHGRIRSHNAVVAEAHTPDVSAESGVAYGTVAM